MTLPRNNLLLLVTVSVVAMAFVTGCATHNAPAPSLTPLRSSVRDAKDTVYDVRKGLRTAQESLAHGDDKVVRLLERQR